MMTIMPEANQSPIGSPATKYDHSAVAIFNARTDAEEAVESPRKAGFDMTKLARAGSQ